MPVSLRCLVMLLGFLSGICAGTALAQNRQNVLPLEPPPENPNAPKRRQATTTEAVRVYQQRLEKSPQNTLARTQLGMAYLKLARETGNEKHYLEAEAEFQKVLKISPKSGSARACLASAYMARHKFQEALELSQAVYKDDSRSTFALATIGDAQLELGQYDDAERTFGELQKKTRVPLPEVLARLARLAELRGQTEQAVELLQKAIGEEQRSRPNSTEIAWYDLRLGEVYFQSGQLENAERHLEAALKRREDFVPALLALGQVRAAQSRYAEAVKLYEQAVAQKPDFDLIGDLGALYALAGNKAKARELEEKAVSLIPVAAKIETEARHLALFLADRDLDLGLALKSARQELKVRRDVFASDVLAWVLLKTGKPQEAEEAMQSALRLGTKDARMHFHAGMIARALGKTDEAKRHLTEALKINPHFSFTGPALAQKALAEL